MVLNFAVANLNICNEWLLTTVTSVVHCHKVKKHVWQWTTRTCCAYYRILKIVHIFDIIKNNFSTMSLLFKILTCRSHILVYILIRFNKSKFFPWNTILIQQHNTILMETHHPHETLRNSTGMGLPPFLKQPCQYWLATSTMGSGNGTATSQWMTRLKIKPLLLGFQIAVCISYSCQQHLSPSYIQYMVSQGRRVRVIFMLMFYIFLDFSS